MRLLNLSFMSILVATPSFAEQSLSIYGGIQDTANSEVKVTDIDGSQYSFDTIWEGRSFEAPPYYGLRYTNWRNENFGFAIDFVHSKAYASDETLSSTGYDVLEFTDGINILSANGLYRLKEIGQITPYFGAGLGISIPHVEVQSPTMDEPNLGYQYGGLAAVALMGASYAVTDHFSIFAETRFDYIKLNVDFGENGQLDTNLINRALNLGVSYNF